MEDVSWKYPESFYWKGGEQCTTKACGLCGSMSDTIGASETFECVECGFVCGRDANASRNILVKNLFGTHVNFAQKKRKMEKHKTEKRDEVAQHQAKRRKNME